jgi:hypothetical protein
MLKILPSRDEEVIRMTRNGVVIAKQAELLNCSEDVIKGIRKRLNLVKERIDPLRPEEKEYILELIRDGLAYSTVADMVSAKFGTQRTRGTVAGVVHRAGAKGAKSPELIVRQMLETKRKNGTLQPACLKKKAVQRSSKHKILTDPKLYPKPERLDLNDVFRGSGVKFSDLEPSMCRWPLDRVDGEHSFCGCHSERKTYCDKHRAVAYR